METKDTFVTSGVVVLRKAMLALDPHLGRSSRFSQSNKFLKLK